MTKLTLFSRKPAHARLVPLVREFAYKSRKNRAYKSRYRNFALKLEAYETNIGTELTTISFTYMVFEDFLYFLNQRRAYRQATFINIKGSLNRTLNYALSKGYKCEFGFSEYEIRKEDSGAVYLCDDEITKIFKVSLKPDAAAVRDRFIIGCCTGLRYSDYSRLTTDHFSSQFVTIKTQKTSEKVVLPVHWMIRDIISRAGGILPVYINSQQNFNKIIKNVCKRAGITDLVVIERTEGNKIVRKKFKKYELISSHTARRSFATNMYLVGVATAKIMLLTGHKTEQAFFKYIRINKQENARELSDHPFFKKP